MTARDVSELETKVLGSVVVIRRRKCESADGFLRAGVTVLGFILTEPEIAKGGGGSMWRTWRKVLVVDRITARERVYWESEAFASPLDADRWIKEPRWGFA